MTETDKNSIQTWHQGYFVDQRKYDRMGEIWKDEQRENEKHLVRPYATGNAICWCPRQDDAAWIAERLNVAAKNDQMAARIEALEAQLAEAERRGAERMRERAAGWHLKNASRRDCPVNFGALHERCAHAIRALPLTEGEKE